MTFHHVSLLRCLTSVWRSFSRSVLCSVLSSVLSSLLSVFGSDFAYRCLVRFSVCRAYLMDSNRFCSHVDSTKDVSRFAYKSFRLHDQVVSPTLKSFRLHRSRKYFAQIDEHHCPQGVEESYLTVFPVNSWFPSSRKCNFEHELIEPTDKSFWYKMDENNYVPTKKTEGLMFAHEI